MRPLLLGEQERADLQSLLAYAKANIMSMDRLLDLVNREKDVPIPGDMQQYVREIPFGYRIVFTLEDQPVGVVRHLSMSVDTVGKLPAPEACEAIMQELGFRGKLPICKVYTSEIGPGRECIEIMEISRPHELA